MKTTTAGDIQKIDEQMRELRQRREAIKDEEFRSVVLPKLMDSVGTAFVYRNNSYSGSKKWDVYRKLIRVIEKNGGAWLIYEECEIDSGSVPALKMATHLTYAEEVPCGWAACPAKEYETNRARVIAQLENPTKLYAEFE